MLANIKYRASLFADYSNIVYDSSIVERLITYDERESLIPSVLPERDAYGNIRSGIILSDARGLLTIAVMSSRIDITVVSDRKEGFREADKAIIKEKVGNYVNRLYSVFGDRIQDACRFAWYTEYVYYEIDEALKYKFRNQFLKEIECVKGKETTEFEANYYAKDNYSVGDKKEDFNLITTISRIFPGMLGNNNVDGFLIGLDINTEQNYKRNRINDKNVADYMDAAIKIQRVLKGGFIEDVYQ